MTEASVLFDILPAAGGTKIGLARLNRPKALNSLNLEMCQLLTQTLLRWQADPEIVLLVLQGEGDRAFCAGGDLMGMYRSMQAHPEKDAWANTYLRDFFASEYRLDYLLHTYGKPVLAMGDGVVMGGGVGLFMGASHRVVSESLRFAMPEVAIGLFPDVAGSWMLGRLPRHIGRFLGMTGVTLEAADTLTFGLADFLLPTEQQTELYRQLQQCRWSGDQGHDHEQLSRILYALSTPASATGPLQHHANLLRRALATGSFPDICRRLLALENHEDEWLRKAVAGLKHGSPTSVRLAYTLQERARHLSLAEVFRMEYIVALQCGANADLQEGIRALLVDKDHAPRWSPASLEQVDESSVQRYFVPPWPDGTVHPLADLDA